VCNFKPCVENMHLHSIVKQKIIIISFEANTLYGILHQVSDDKNLIIIDVEQTWRI
jgi:small nuclear ribonucleoprotein (snRNP)-like protein